MSTIDLKLPEQEFETPEEYIANKLVPVCSELKRLVEGLEDKSERYVAYSSAGNPNEWAKIDKVVKCDPLTAFCDTELYPLKMNDKRRRVMAVVTCYCATQRPTSAGEACLSVCCNTNGEAVGGENIRYDDTQTLRFEIAPDNGAHKYHLQSKSVFGNSKVVVEDFRIEVEYVE